MNSVFVITCVQTTHKNTRFDISAIQRASYRTEMLPVGHFLDKSVTFSVMC